MHQLTENASLLKQALLLLGSISDADFAAVSPLGASVGSHFRHIIDFYSVFLRDLTSDRIDYDLRDRDPALETSRILTAEHCASLLARLPAAALDPEHVIFVKSETSDPPVYSPSSVGRELQFLASHTVHHFALISCTLVARGVPVPPEFGVAPSTLAYRRGP